MAMQGPMPGDRIQLSAGPWNLRGEACSPIDGIEVRVPGLIPDEQALVTITGRSRGGPVAWGTAEVPPPTSRRRAPPCQIHGSCGGCGLQYATEEARFAALVAGRTALLPPSVAATLAPENQWVRSPGFGWRHKAVLLPSWRRGQLLLGGYGRGTHEVVDQPDCRVLSDALRQARRTVGDSLSELVRAGLRLAPPGGRSSRGLRAMVLRANRTGAVLLTAVVRGPEDVELVRPWLEDLVSSGDLAGAFHQVFAAPSDAVHGRTPPQWVAGVRSLTETVGGVPLPVQPLAFFQVNPGVLEGIVDVLRGLALPTETLLDAYCGVGALGLAIVGQEEVRPRIVGCDVVPGAIAAAEKAAQALGLDARYVLGSPSDIQEAVGVAVVDPPRKGCSAKELAALVACAPERILYVSCSAPSLARDTARLLESGYRATGLWPADMLPQTAHLEMVASFERVP
ncbi:MAG: hypothetical protein KDA24_00865 [Deltaproteobacteria bacterium]|nr:hypothetical protein [Deltaproteobacteria bacterium]